MSLALHNTTMIMILVERGYIEYKLNSMPLFTTFNGMLNMAYCKYSRFLIVSLWQNMMPNRRIMHHEEIGEERISGKQYDVRQREKAKASWSERAARRHNGNCSCSAVSVSVICHLIENLLQINVNLLGLQWYHALQFVGGVLWNCHCKREFTDANATKHFRIRILSQLERPKIVVGNFRLSPGYKGEVNAVCVCDVVCVAYPISSSDV